MKQIIKEIKNPKINDFEFLFSEKNLKKSTDILKWLLDKEKKRFKEKIKNFKDGTKPSFETFQDDSILDIYWSYLNHLKWVYDTKQIRDIIDDFEPYIIEFSNEVAYNKTYYEMLKSCIEDCNLNDEQKKIIEESIKYYEARWINLEKSKQSRLKKIKGKLTKLSNRFSNNLLDSQKEFLYHIETKKTLEELPEEILEQTGKKAKEQWKEWYIFTSNPSEYIAIMKYCSDGNIRKDFYEKKHSFASNWKYDNRKIVLEILKLREEKANILWYKNYAELSLEFKMAKSPEEIVNLFENINKKARIKAKKEIKELKRYFNLSNLQDWDLSYYFRKYKEENYKINEKEIKEFFEFEKVLLWLHQIVYKLYWLEFKVKKQESQLLDKENKIFWDVRFYEVYKDWRLISYYILDPFYRAEKRSWAWADNIRDKYKWRIPIIVNVCNFNPPWFVDWSKEKISLMSILDVETLFHEFGHAIHEISSKSYYTELTWFDVEWDFIEVPSQFLEHYTGEKESLDIFALNYKNGKKIPKNILDSLKKSKNLWSWNFVLRQNEFWFLDIILHSKKAPENIKKLDEITLNIANKYGINKKEENYKMYAWFSHIFAWWYASGYYSYMWAEIIELDIWSEFKKNWIFDKKTGKKFFDTILSAWSYKKAPDMFFDFMWREPNIEAFIKDKGFGV